MRMDPHAGFSAYDIVNTWDGQDLKDLLSTYGEEPRAGRIARAIESARPLAVLVAVSL